MTLTPSQNSLEPPPASYASKSGLIVIRTNGSDDEFVVDSHSGLNSGRHSCQGHDSADQIRLTNTQLYSVPQRIHSSLQLTEIAASDVESRSLDTHNDLRGEISNSARHMQLDNQHLSLQED